MDVKEILRHVDHTLLAPTATWEEIRQICDDGIKYGCASVCIPQTYVAHAAHYIAEQQHYGFGQLPVCTVIGFPNGYVPSGIKCMEAESAVADGATEIDMVINVELVKDARLHELEEEIAAVRRVVPAPRVLKVIIESAALSDDEIVAACTASMAAGADFVKTSTGFHPAGGASTHAVALMRATVGDALGVKASGGIRDAETALAMIEAGASRLGVSATNAILAGLED